MAVRQKRRRTTKPKAKRGEGSLTHKQHEVLALTRGGQTIVEIADLLDTTPGAIKAQISRIRKAGVEVGVKAGSAPPSPPQIVAAPLPVSDEPAPSMTVEDHIGIDLAGIDARLAEVGGLLASLTEEQVTLSERKGRLEAAVAELAPGREARALSVVA